MTRKLLEVAADIVQAQVSTNAMSSEEIVSSLRNVFNTLQAIQKSEMEGVSLEVSRLSEEVPPEERAPERVDPKSSIQDERIICLECGAEMRQLTAKHLNAHELSPREYKQKWGFPLKQPLSAKSLTKARSKAAKKRGLPANLIKFQEERKQMKSEAAATEGARMETTEEMPEIQAEPKRSRKKKAE